MDENMSENLQNEDNDTLIKEELDSESRDLSLLSEAEKEADQMSIEDDQEPIKGKVGEESMTLPQLDLSGSSSEGSEIESVSESEGEFEDIITEAYNDTEQNYEEEFIEVENPTVTTLAHFSDMGHAAQQDPEHQDFEQHDFEQQDFEQQDFEQQDFEQQDFEQPEQQEIMSASPSVEDTLPESINQPYCDLQSFSYNVTEEDQIKRNEKLLETGTFFTREAYEEFTMYPPVVVDEELEHIIQIAEQRANKRQSNQLMDEELQQMEDVELPDTPIESIGEVQQQQSPELVPLDEIVPDTEPVVEVPVVETNVRKKQKIAGPTVLDTVLTDMLRYNRSQASTSEPSDLEIAAMAAGLSTLTQDDGKPHSNFTKENHVRFLRISEALKTGSTNIPESDMEMYKHMCVELKHEQDNFIKDQRKQVYESGVYDILDEKVEKMVQEYCENENMRLSQYPQYYKYFNLLQMPAPNSVADSSILSFKHSLLQTGKIATCKPSAMETPRRLDLFKKYIFTSQKESDEIDIEEDEDEDLYYKKKLPPTVSVDENITQLMKNNDADIIISSECLIAIVELVHDISLDLYIPIKVVEKDNKKTLILDRPLPRKEMTARERNKLVYDVAFKSLCLDWSNRHDISPAPEGSTDKQNDQEENLQYNMWTFGDMNILIRHQIDGELIENATKKPGSKDRRVYLTSKLDYQIHQGREEITTAIERSTNWLRSYVGGHATVLEGRIDVVNNRLVRVDRKEMVDIMGGQWRPMLESELLRYTFSKLHKMLLVPGNYLLKHKKDDRNFLIFQSANKSNDLDLSLKKIDPSLAKSEKSFIPAWSAIENQIPWTFPPK